MNTVVAAKRPVIANGNGNGNGNDHHHKKIFNGNRGAMLTDIQRDVLEALSTVGSHGSVEIYVQDYAVTQITARMIKKTKHPLRDTA